MYFIIMKASIQGIKNQIELLEETVEKFLNRERDIREMNDIVFQESSLQDVIDDVNFILKQIAYLLKSHNLFIRISTLGERNTLNSHLSNLNSYLSNSNFHYISSQIDWIKSILRNYNTFIFTRKDYVSDIYEELTKLQQIQWEAKELLWDIFNSVEKKEDVIVRLENLENDYNELENKLKASEEKKNEIVNFHSESKWYKEVMENFSKNINDRTAQLELQEKKTNDFESKLTDFSKKQSEFTSEAEKLITSAKNALKYKTAEGISASIQAQYDSAKNETTAGWLVWSWIFIFMTLWLGIWLLWDKEVSIEVLIWRIALLPITVAWAIFTANQYVKQKNLIEDYAYKLVLTKSIVWFSEELLKVDQTNDWYQKYISKVLEELLQDPLRIKSKFNDKTLSTDDLKEWLSVIKDIKNL